MKRIIYILIVAYCIISPFYFFNSGYPQISDVLLIFAFLLFIFNYRIKKDKILFIMMFILLLISIINLSWGIIYSTFGFMLSTVYYVFNFMLLILVLNLYYRHGKEVLNILYKAIFASIILQMIISPFLVNTGLTRQTLMFNNPNQLGYYALLSFCILTLLFYLLNKSLLHYIFISLIVIYLVLLSNSSSTLLAILFILSVQLVLIYFYRFNMKQKFLFIFFIFFMFIVGRLFWSDLSNITLIDNAVNRLSGKEITTSSNIVYERGYNRMFENPNLLIVGAGEGLTKERFGRGEMHSTLVSFLFDYGIITMPFLIVLFLFLIKKPTLIPLLILLSIHFYGLTHNGIRQPLFWLTNAVIFIGNTEGQLGLSNISNQIRKSKINKNLV